MKAGALDRKITIQRVTTGSTASGAVSETWATLVTLRAELVQASTAEFQRAFGASTETAAIFRTRFYSSPYYGDVTVADRVSYEGATFSIVEIKEIGRRRGLELRCTRVGP